MNDFSLKIHPKIKIQTFFSAVLLIILIVISVRYCDLHDYSEYYRTYSHLHQMTVEIGYTHISQLFYKMGYPFYVFYGVAISFVLISVWCFFYKYGYFHLSLFIVFIIYPYINELQQLRSSIAAAIVLIGFRFILNDKTEPLKYALVVMIAMLFHTTSVFYLFFIAAIYLNHTLIKKITAYSFVLAIPLIAFFRFAATKIIPLFPYLSLKYSKHVDYGRIFNGAVIIDWVIFGVVFVIINYVFDMEYDSLSERTKKLINISNFIFIMTLFRGLGNNGYRIALMMYPVFYVLLTRVIKESDKQSNRLIIKSVLYLFPVVCIFVWWGPFFYPNMNDIVKNEMWKVWDQFYYWSD